MWPIFNLQWLRLKREPYLALIFLALTVGFVFFIGGAQGEQTITVQTYSEQLSEPELEEWVDQLNETEGFQFEISDQETVEQRIQMGQSNFALELNQDHYRYLVGQESEFISAVNQHVEKIYQTELRINEVTEQFPDQTIELQNYLEIESRSLTGTAAMSEQADIQIIAGMTLYFALYTVLYSLMNIAVEKRTGTWDRLIVSPLNKSSIYLGQLLHYFLLGIFQIGICFIIFEQFLNYQLGSQYLAILVSIMAFTFTSVALGMFIISLIKSPQQLQAVIPIVATGMAMLGGAFWPIDIVTNNIVVTLGKLTPIYHGIQALQQAILYDAGAMDLLQPISMLLLMGVLFMGIGINLMERIK
ncbi:ABC transporter permease [Amphibacillus sp. Q70]|uniref:ABC transporter permease n=1 Tax=Amphibacillus sp. Q70 TaxID=3453416 RepID=UPI003F82AECA